jgi:hypothetical protein
MPARPVYSQRFYEASLQDGTGSYTVPEGFRAVFKCIDFFYSPTLPPAVAQVGGPIGQTWCLAVFTGGLQPQHVQWTGTQVMFPGDTVVFYTSGAIDITASGYLLTIP